MAFGIEDEELEGITEKLFNCAMQSDWEEVVRICKQHPCARKAEIPASGETILHMAVSAEKAKIVEQLVEQISEPELDALKIRNEEGDTPLHLAASIGNVQMCECITAKDPDLVGVRNSKTETPLFLAALHGQKDAFLFLHRMCESSQRQDYCRRNDGRTILHCVINGEYFDLAFQIIHLYEDLVDLDDEKGLTPLHLLASKPTAFRSGAPLSWIENIIYHCVFVEDLKEDERDQQSPQTSKSENILQCPENYQTCMNFWKIIKTSATTIFGSDSQKDEDAENPQAHQSMNQAQQQMFPPNCDICFEFIKFAYKIMLVFLGIGFNKIKKIRDMKEKHSRAVQLINELLRRVSRSKHNLEKEEERKNTRELGKSETPILIAAKNGVTEMVEKILQVNPVAINDRNSQNKNVVLLAVENRQPEVYELLVKRKFLKDSVFQAVDDEENSALHLAAMLSDYLPWHIPGAALQMQWEIKWYKYVKSSMPQHFFSHYNRKKLTPKEIFTKSHDNLLKKGGKWLNSTSSSCSVVATLIAAVAFATSATVPGGFNEKFGKPNFAHESAFNLFAVSSLIALCFSVTSLVMFLAILTSRHQEDDFHKGLPRKLLFGLTALFISIAAMLVSFCAGHFFVLRDELKHVALPVYAVSCLPVSFFAVAQFSLYVDLVWATFSRVPQRRYKVVF